ncbi:MAG: hypothetical protein BWY99_01663 [Synergistetes bacterium ADurb.BinA166]|nr:MAG: hypothetical protein BWY99_01663 [Synergistetes bacterium ADurb.BinA166]
MDSWKCRTCGERHSLQLKFCRQCGTAASPPSRASLASFSEVLDTKSFVVPVKRRVIWIWAAIGVGFPTLMTGAWFLYRLLFR